MIYPKRFG